MDRVESTCNIPHREKLNKQVKDRYANKLKDIGVDPYEHTDWSGDLDQLPDVTLPDVCLFLVIGVSACTPEQFRDYRSLEAHHQFTTGLVQDLQIFRGDHHKTVVRTKVLQSQRLSGAPLQSWVIFGSSGEVDCAHCTCMTGLEESCTHVGALLFKIEAAVRLRGAAAAVPDAPAKETRRTGVGWTCPCSRQHTLSDLSPLLQILHTHSRAVGLSGMEDYYRQYADPVTTQTAEPSAESQPQEGQENGPERT